MVDINNKTKSKIDLVLVKRVVKEFLQVYKKRDYEVSIAFVGDKTIRKLNKIYCRIDRVTDVLAFPDTTIEPSTADKTFLGEVIIDYAQIKRQAKQFNNSIRNELIFILVHGLLHLLGYDDKTEKGRREMEELGEEFVKVIRS